MQTVNIHYAKTHLSRLIEEAAKGESFVIAKAGKPRVRVIAVDDPPAPPHDSGKRLGFLEGKFKVPDNFKEIGREEIEKMFGLND